MSALYNPRLFRELKDKVYCEYTGKIVGHFELKDNTRVYVTKEDTINKNIVKACLFHEGKKAFCVRYKREGFGIVKAQEMATRFCVENNIGVFYE